MRAIWHSGEKDKQWQEKQVLNIDSAILRKGRGKEGRGEEGEGGMDEAQSLTKQPLLL